MSVGVTTDQKQSKQNLSCW